MADYQAKTNNLRTQLDDTITTLIPGNFSGSAADGFKDFYTNKIDPIVDEGLTGIITALHDIVEGTLEAIPDTDGLDDQLGEGNKSV